VGRRVALLSIAGFPATEVTVRLKRRTSFGFSSELESVVLQRGLLLRHAVECAKPQHEVDGMDADYRTIRNEF
jgi:hypothetical protein